MLDRRTERCGSCYSASVTNLAQTSLSKDMVFSDSYSVETPTISGSVTAGLTLTMTVSVG